VEAGQNNATKGGEKEEKFTPDYGKEKRERARLTRGKGELGGPYCRQGGKIILYFHTNGKGGGKKRRSNNNNVDRERDRGGEKLAAVGGEGKKVLPWPKEGRGKKKIAPLCWPRASSSEGGEGEYLCTGRGKGGKERVEWVEPPSTKKKGKGSSIPGKGRARSQGEKPFCIRKGEEGRFVGEEDAVIFPGEGVQKKRPSPKGNCFSRVCIRRKRRKKSFLKKEKEGRRGSLRKETL